MGYDQCSGTSLSPVEPIDRKLIGGLIIAVAGSCRKCGKHCALTIAGNIRAHKARIPPPPPPAPVT